MNIAIMGAMPEEIAPLLEKVGIRKFKEGKVLMDFY